MVVCSCLISAQDQLIDMQFHMIDDGLYQKSKPVPGAKEGLQQLKDMGYKLIIITARAEASREVSEDWIAEYMPDSEPLSSLTIGLKQ